MNSLCIGKTAKPRGQKSVIAGNIAGMIDAELCYLDLELTKGDC